MSDNGLVFLSETARALFAELEEVKTAYDSGAKLNRKYLLSLAERISQEIPAASVEALSELFRRSAEHLDSGEANEAMVAQARAGMLRPEDELAALEYERSLIDDRIEHLRWLREYPQVAAAFETEAGE